MARRVRENSYSFLLRVLNVVIRWLQPLGITPSKLRVESITKKAKRRTGLDDTGNPVYKDGMNKLVEAVNRSAVTDFGKFTSTGFGVDALSNRLRMVDYFKRHPEVADVKIDRPVFIVGFPRTGTTLLQNLMHLGEDRRALEFWELTNPVPLHRDTDKDVKKRKCITKSRLAIANFVVPEMKFIHEVRHDSLEECWSLFIPQFAVPNWDMTSRWPDYGEWMLNNDLRDAYKEYKKFLQIMVHRVPDKKLILKCPDHMWHLDALLDVFPDACIVWTHRDPGKSIPSYCSLASLNWRLVYGEFNPKELGPYLETRLKTGIEKGLKARAASDESRFLDINFNELLDNPIGAVNHITNHFNISQVPNDKMRQYLDTDRPDNKGKHKYSDDYYGLNADLIREHYKDYISRFGISIN